MLNVGASVPKDLEDLANRNFSNSARKNAKFCACVSTGCDILGQHLISKDVGHRSCKGRLRELALFSVVEMRRRVRKI